MSSLHASRTSWPWPADRAGERKSGLCASLMTASLFLAFLLALLAQAGPELISLPPRQSLRLEMRLLPLPEPQKPIPDDLQKLTSPLPDPDAEVIKTPPPPPKVKPEPVLAPRPEPIIPPKPEPRPLPEKVLKTELKRTPKAAPATRVEAAPPLPDAVDLELESRARARSEAILAELLQAVEKNKHYPKQARRSGAEGVTVLRFNIGADGKIKASALVEPSGKRVLDLAARDLGEKLVGMSLKAGAGGGPVAILVPVHYRLR